jgi:hypothetical protein
MTTFQGYTPPKIGVIVQRYYNRQRFELYQKQAIAATAETRGFNYN